MRRWCVGAAFLSPPLQLAVRSVATSNSASTLDAVTLDVHNTTGQAVTPHFMVTVGSGGPAGFWYPDDADQDVLGPHDSETVTLRPTASFGAPTYGSQWLVEAYTTSPEALSTTPLMYWRMGRAALTVGRGRAPRHRRS